MLDVYSLYMGIFEEEHKETWIERIFTASQTRAEWCLKPVYVTPDTAAPPI
jgi:hypothetical protein